MLLKRRVYVIKSLSVYWYFFYLFWKDKLCIIWWPLNSLIKYFFQRLLLIYQPEWKCRNQLVKKDNIFPSRPRRDIVIIFAIRGVTIIVRIFINGLAKSLAVSFFTVDSVLLHRSECSSNCIMFACKLHRATPSAICYEANWKTSLGRN